LSALELKQRLGLISCPDEHRRVSADDIANIRRKSLDDVARGFYDYLQKALTMNGSPVFTDLRASLSHSPTGPNRKQPGFSSTEETRQATKDLLIGIILDTKTLSVQEPGTDQSGADSPVQLAANKLVGVLSNQQQASSAIDTIFKAGLDPSTSRELRRSEYIVNSNIQVFETAVGSFPEMYILAAEDGTKEHQESKTG